MDENSNIIKLPPIDKWLGSCPECGKAIWESYAFHEETIKLNETHKIIKIYKCIECKEYIEEEAIIPF